MHSTTMKNHGTTRRIIPKREGLQTPKNDEIYAYTVCNGLSNQLLHHAAHLSKAKQLGYRHVAIPNHFILKGTQTSNADVGVTLQNSIPFGHAFDAPHFLHVLQTQLQLQGHFVDQATTTKATTSTNPVCLSLSQAFKGSDPVEVGILLQSAFRPSREHMEPIVETILQRLRSQSSSSSNGGNINDDDNGNDPYRHGVCLHDRNGQDWIDHCRRWSSISDGVYRGNCLPYLPRTNEESSSWPPPSSSSIEFLDNIKARVFSDLQPAEAAAGSATGQPPVHQRWVYYCGDHTNIPSTLLQASASYRESNGEDQNHSLHHHHHNNRNNAKSSSTTPLYSHITSHHLLLQQEKSSSSSSSLSRSGHHRNSSSPASSSSSSLHDLLAQQQRILATQYGLSNQLDLHRDARDFWALLDFYVCRTLPRFVGNSVSTFSAIQIALRNGHGAYWYNTQSIPLQDMWRVFQVPLVYTYTELSATTGRHLLQTSIESARSHMPHNKIHILYHGQNDTKFKKWLKRRNVIVHDHHPTWKDQIEQMRLNGDAHSSNLFLHSGNYLGTWQRIDVPMFLDTEYVLLLDSDTVIRKPFTLADFGLNLTRGIAMSSEINFHDTKPSNAGVTLMNIPHLRQTHTEFMAFIMRHVEKGRFDHPSPSDQGAYLVFYNDSVRFLSPYFNFKPYWELSDKEFRRSYIVHFHGPKPHDYVRFIMGKGCDTAVKFLCNRGVNLSPSLLCQSLSAFASASISVDRYSYCQASFRVRSQAAFCQELFEDTSSPSHRCKEFYKLIQGALDKLPPSLKLPRSLILKRLGLSQHGSLYWYVLYGGAVCCWVAIAVLSVRMRSTSSRTVLNGLLGLSLGWSVLSVILAAIHLE